MPKVRNVGMFLHPCLRWHLSFKRFHMALDSEGFLKRKRQNKPKQKPAENKRSERNYFRKFHDF